MNIFYLHSDPAKAASYFYDKHKVKMILESAQMLCTAHHCYGNAEQKADVPYTYMWLYDHMIALGKEYTKRYGKKHLTIEKCREFLATPPAHIQGDNWCEPPQCMPDEYKRSSAIHGYWNYYIAEKTSIRNKNEVELIKPKWIKSILNTQLSV